MIQTTVVNIKTTPDFDIRNHNDVYIGRFHHSATYGMLPTSKWHNPYKLGESLFGTSVSRKEAIDMFKDSIVHNPELMASLHELEGKRLGCWCKPLPCHGDVLVELLDALAQKV